MLIKLFHIYLFHLHNCIVGRLHDQYTHTHTHTHTHPTIALGIKFPTYELLREHIQTIATLITGYFQNFSSIGI